MLYVVFRGNHPNLSYTGGQEPIAHLEADLYDVVAWANEVSHRWAFTTSNAGSNYFNDYSDLAYLSEINWDAVAANNWSNVREGKQAEFLIEHSFPWELVSRIGVYSRTIQIQAQAVLKEVTHQPPVHIMHDWYY